MNRLFTICLFITAIATFCNILADDIQVHLTYTDVNGKEQTEDIGRLPCSVTNKEEVMKEMCVTRLATLINKKATTQYSAECISAQGSCPGPVFQVSMVEAPVNSCKLALKLQGIRMLR